MSNLSPNSTEVLHVAAFAFPYGTHANPLLNIIKKLATLAPNVMFSFFSTKESNNKIFSTSQKGDNNISVTKFLLPNIKAYDVWDGLPEGYVFKGNFSEIVELFLVSAPASIRKAVAEAEEERGRKVSCMMGDAFLWFVVDIAQEKGVPWVPAFMSEEHALSVHVYTDLIRDTIGIHEVAESRKEEFLDFIPGMSTIKVGDLPDGIVTGNLESAFAKMVHQMGRVLPQASAVCLNSCEELNSVALSDLKLKLPNLLCLGPLSLIMPPPKTQDSSNCLPWLEKQAQDNSVVAYVSFGSMASPGPSEIAALAQGLESSGVKFLWSIRDNLKENLPQKFLENMEKGMIVPWAPQTDVLAHSAVKVFITHFGCNSIMESIASGIPLIGRPFHGEQNLNARLVENLWEIGLKVEGGVFTKDGVCKSLKQVLRDDQGIKMRENVNGLKELVQKAIAPKGSCNDNFNKLFKLVTKS